MTIDEIAAYAVDLKENRGYNCAQSVLEALRIEANLSEEEVISLGAGFCAGMGTMEATCGALIGAVMVLGLKTKGNSTLRLAREVQLDFKKNSKAITCRDLKSKVDGKVLCPCRECVRNAVLAYGRAMNIK